MSVGAAGQPRAIGRVARWQRIIPGGAAAQFLAQRRLEAVAGRGIGAYTLVIAEVAVHLEQAAVDEQRQFGARRVQRRLGRLAFVVQRQVPQKYRGFSKKWHIVDRQCRQPLALLRAQWRQAKRKGGDETGVARV